MKWWAIGLLLVAINATAEELRIGFGTHKPPYIFQGEQRGLEYDIVVAEYEEVIGDLRQLVETDLPALNEKLDEAGAPWTPGRKIPDIK